MLEKTLFTIKKYIPKSVFTWIQPPYHYSLAFLAALCCGFPSRKINVVAVTGTKGKSSTTELVSAILEEAGYKTALSNTIRFKVDDESTDNTFKMSMPGRFFIQRFLKKAVKNKCQYAVIEMTSEGARLYRHKFIELDALIFTNLSPEHIESHGSFENYVKAKLSIGQALENSKKTKRILVANNDDKESRRFLDLHIPEKHTFSLSDAEPYTLHKEGLEFTFSREKMHSHLSGVFNIYNILGAITYAKTQSIDTETIKRALKKFTGIKGRLEKIEAGQDFTVIVDYAHTPDSLEKLYQVYPNSKKICVLGNTGGGRDTWKRKEMARIADNYCDHIILTNEDPYDDDPRKIVEDMAEAITDTQCETIMDRREALREAFKHATTGDTVLITGKGTDPYIMGPAGTKIPWNDAEVAQEELQKLLAK